MKKLLTQLKDEWEKGLLGVSGLAAVIYALLYALGATTDDFEVHGGESVRQTPRLFREDAFAFLEGRPTEEWLQNEPFQSGVSFAAQPKKGKERPGKKPPKAGKEEPPDGKGGKGNGERPAKQAGDHAPDKPPDKQDGKPAEPPDKKPAAQAGKGKGNGKADAPAKLPPKTVKRVKNDVKYCGIVTTRRAFLIVENKKTKERRHIYPHRQETPLLTPSGETAVIKFKQQKTFNIKQ